MSKTIYVTTVVYALCALGGCFATLSCQDSNLKLRSHYDFIIVGAGSAGAVVANRLSESKHITVLLLEVGGDETPILNEIPQMNGYLMNSYQDWQFKTETQTSKFFGNYSKKFVWSEGKVLGGSSSINGMVYVRGNRRDFEAWNQETDGEWSWDKVLPFFRKSEDNSLTNFDVPYHGNDGYLTVSEPTKDLPSANMLVKAGEEMGLTMRDINGQFQTGIMHVQSTIRDGARCSTNKAFLKSASDRSNLDVVTYAYVRKVTLKKLPNNSAKATGVEFQCGKFRRTVLSRKEVILSAGTVNSPHLLLLSGIGPRNQLEKHNIPVVVDLPGVGRNLHDQFVVTSMQFVKQTVETGNSCPVTDSYQSDLLQWSFDRTGPLSLPWQSVVGFIKTSRANQDDDWPDIQITMSTPAVSTEAVFDKNQTTTTTVITCLATLLRPRSVGSLELRSDDPVTPPSIDPRYMSDQYDVDVLLEGAKFCISLGDTTVLKEAGYRSNIVSFPACAKHEKSSEQYFRCAVQQGGVPGWHFGGTCKMGKDKDPLAVVDSQLRVFNVADLRVIDASIMSQVTSGNTNAPSIMIGEKGSDFIKRIWKLRSHSN